MRRFLAILALIGLAVLFGTTGQAAEKPQKVQVLLITGDDVSVHPWREMSEATRDALVSTGKFDVKVCEDPLILNPRMPSSSTASSSSPSTPPSRGPPATGLRRTF
jgi:hypothetical protein